MKSQGRKRHKVLFCGLPFLVVFLATTAAWGARKVVAKPVQAPAALKGAEGEKGVKTDAQSDYIYDPTGKPDPFKSFIAKQEEYEAKKKVKPKTYLETLDLSQLDLIATVLSPKGNWAMVRDAKGLGHVIRKGTLIGTHEGVVERISEGEILIKEKHLDIRGNVVVREVKKKTASKK